MRRGWISRAVEIMRLTRVIAYVLIALAGGASILWPPLSVTQASEGRPVAYVWAGLMAVSGLFCAAGAATDRWIGEYVGLVPLSLVAAIFGVSALSRGNVSWAGGLFLLGFFWILIARWQEVALIRVEADRTARERSGQPDSDGTGGEA